MSPLGKPWILGSKRRSDDVIDDPEVQSELRRLDGMIPEGPICTMEVLLTIHQYPG